MPMRGMEMRAVTAVAGAAAAATAAAFRWAAASAGGTVASGFALGEAAFDGPVEAAVRTLLAVARRLAGARTSMIAAMASKRNRPTPARTRGFRLMPPITPT